MFSAIREESFTSVSLEMRSLKCMSRSQSFLDVNDLTDQLHASQSSCSVSHSALSPTLRRKASGEAKSKQSGVARNPLLQLKEDTSEYELQSDARKMQSNNDDESCAATGTCKINKKRWHAPKRFAIPQDSSAEQKREELHTEATEAKPTTDVDLACDELLPGNQDKSVEVSDTQMLQPDEKDERSEQKQRRFRTKIAPFSIDVMQSSSICNCCNSKSCACCVIL